MYEVRNRQRKETRSAEFKQCLHPHENEILNHTKEKSRSEPAQKMSRERKEKSSVENQTALSLLSSSRVKYQKSRVIKLHGSNRLKCKIASGQTLLTQSSGEKVQACRTSYLLIFPNF